MWEGTLSQVAFPGWRSTEKVVLNIKILVFTFSFSPHCISSKANPNQNYKVLKSQLQPLV